ncbi:o-succinylbenzoate synthase [Nonomuraea turcica]|uniref:o-succinylbenzoate synthase n=1 Tax=Nonomuraea sp. G32 TaxID=3067274 RepID=UPI00273CA976|nr:o-succinylbenzoate synthase [Nonomuraea sp. G32]MDP4505208.1 o-succinylbenzoate synthase [Nonomuraea sp. G32]
MAGSPEAPGVPAVFRIPMRLRFRGQTVREGVLLRGPAGWGEFSPFPEYGPRECARWLACAREAAFEGWPEPVRDSVPVNATVPAVDPERAYELVRRSGCGTAKVKVGERGQTFDEDVARVEAVRDALGPAGRLRVDVNGAWSVDEAVRRLKRLDTYDLEYAEQPCATLEELAAVRRACDVPIAADESIRRAEDPLRVRAAEAADVAVVKVQPLGGVRNALRVVEACGLPAVVSSAVETSVGLAAGLALAAALPSLPYACGLGTLPLLAGDVVDDPLTPVDGRLAVRRPSVDDQQLSAFEIESPQWLRRMQEASR